MKLIKNPVFLDYYSKVMGILLFILKYIDISLLLKMKNGFSWPAKIMASPFNVNTLLWTSLTAFMMTDLISVHNLHQFVNKPTYHKPEPVPSLLDHINSNDPDLITHVDYPPPPPVHVTILWFTAGLEFNMFNKPTLLFCCIIWQYNKTGWARANDMLYSIISLSKRVDINHAWDHFHSFFMNVIDQCVPKKSVKCKA